MAVKVAINGFGRIGRNVLRAIVESGRDDIEVIAINDLGPVETNAHLMRYDSVHGRFPGKVTVEGDTMDVGRGPIRVTAERDPKALPWGDVKGYYLRHLRWWAKLPITDRSGVLTVGFGYANLLMSENYNSAGSPYWAFKAFLPLALPASHPFWTAEEKPVPVFSEPSPQPQPGMVMNSQALPLAVRVRWRMTEDS